MDNFERVSFFKYLLFSIPSAIYCNANSEISFEVMLRSIKNTGDNCNNIDIPKKSLSSYVKIYY